MHGYIVSRSKQLRARRSCESGAGEISRIEEKQRNFTSSYRVREWEKSKVYLVAARIEEVLELDNVGVLQLPHYLKLTVLHKQNNKYTHSDSFTET